MRLDLRDGINNCTLINDSYNSDLTSLTIALDFLHQQKQNPQKMLILSDVQQSGKGESELYAEIAHIVSNQNINMFFGVGSALTKHKNKFSRNSKFFNTTESLLAHFQNNKYKNCTILIKGAREFRFERILHILEKKTHRTVLEINLNALVNNLNFFRSLLEKKTKIMAMVKAFSYGAGGFEIANVLAHHRVDYLAVAYIDEGVELRKAGVTLPIMVMNPETEFFDILIEYNLEPEIFNFEGLRLLYETARRNSEQKVNVHIKLDTGMKRLGFTDSDLIPLFNALNSYDNIQVVSVFSHLATSDEVANDNFTLHQLNLFQRMSFAFLQNFNYPIMRHILNSAGIERFPNYQFEMVRLGIGLYGVCTEKKSELQEISSLKTHISQIKIVRAGETIGYGRKGKALLDTRIATIAIGYADGINRKLSNGNWKVIINGKKAPIIGNICMDMCMIDLSGIQANEGDEVIVFGKDNSICEMATKLETIPYEIMTGISRRVKKVYFHE
jgi:alanine racemase